MIPMPKKLGNLPPWVEVAALVVAEAEQATDLTPESSIKQWCLIKMP